MNGPLRTPAASLALIVALALASATAACGGGAQEPSPSPTSSIEPLERGIATLYFVADTPKGFRLFPEVREITIAGADLATDALRALLDDATTPLDPDYASLWSDADTSLLSLTRDGSEATIDLAYGRLNVGSETEARAIDQLVWTVVTADPSIRSVRITVDGETVESLAGHVDATRPSEPGESYGVLADVSILTPSEGASLSGAVTIAGEACTFEANVAWRLLLGDQQVDAGATTAAEACPVRSPWTIDLGMLAPGDYTLFAFELSPKDGSLVVSDSRTFTVVGS